MTKDEFISYTKGIIALELERARIEMLSERRAGDIELAGALRLIKDALDNITPEPVTYMQGVTNVNTNTEMIPYHEQIGRAHV